MHEILPALTALDKQISAARENIRELIEQAAAYSGAADDDLVMKRIEDKEKLLQHLTERRDNLSQQLTVRHKEK